MVALGEGVRDGVGVGEGVLDPVGVTDGVLDAVAPNEREGVGVCDGVGVCEDVMEGVRLMLEVKEGVLGERVALGVGVRVGAATSEKVAELRV